MQFISKNAITMHHSSRNSYKDPRRASTPECVWNSRDCCSRSETDTRGKNKRQQVNLWKCVFVKDKHRLFITYMKKKINDGRSWWDEIWSVRQTGLHVKPTKQIKLDWDRIQMEFKSQRTRWGNFLLKKSPDYFVIRNSHQVNVGLNKLISLFCLSTK